MLYLPLRGGIARASTLFASAGTSLLTLVLALIMISMPIMGWAQTPCFPTCSITGYKCILASSNYFSPTPIGNLIGSGVNQLTPMPNAGTTQQEVVVKGWIEVNASYTFATGSDIVFADSESGFIVSEGATLTFKASNPPFSLTTLRGCSLVMCWK